MLENKLDLASSNYRRLEYTKDEIA